MRRKMEKKRLWTFADFIEMEFGYRPDPSAEEKGRPGAGTPLDGGMDENTELQSTSVRIPHARRIIKNGGAQ